MHVNSFVRQIAWRRNALRVEVPDIPPSQRDLLTKTLAECAEEIERADASHPKQKVYMNFQLALGLLRDAQWLFESEVSPRETTVAAGQLRSLVLGLQMFNAGSAAPSVTAAQQRIGRLVQELDPDQTDLR
jgi:hypothetical protein